MSPSLRIALLLPLSLAAFVVLFVMPDVDLGWLGGIALLGGSWLAWYQLWLALRDGAAQARLGEGGAWPSPGEQGAWIGAFFTAVILAYLGLHGDEMIGPDGGRAREASAIGRHIAFLVVAWLVVMQVLRNHRRDAVEADERDRAIQARAASWARGGLVVFLIGVAVLTAFTPPARLAWASPMRVSNVMMAAVIASCLLEYLVTGVAYWRDRRAVA